MFWDIFYNLCNERGVKPNAVCKELGFSNATATHWKAGKTPKSDTIQKIAAYFGVSTDYLLTGEEQKKPPVTMLREQLDSICGDLPEDKQKQLIDYAKFLLSQPENEE